ncbi:MAG: DUF3108 domain-containing protein [Acidobacteria bacterium]|nr:DUF3108 domain-containing protein [Acidobacteriota bacterium]MCA1649159.1 DUF3108 domain-containing protein [Acidobacteriota bacterium]
MSRLLPVALAVASVCALSVDAQQATPKSTPRKEPAVPFKVGERLTYDVEWSTYVTAGSATMAVVDKQPSSNSTVYAIVAEGRPSALLSALYSLSYRVDTLLDSYALLPQRTSVFSQEGRRQRTKVTSFDHAARKARYEVRTATIVRKDIPISAQTLDALAALYVLRTMPLRTNDRFSMSICDNGNVYTVQVAVGGVESITTGIGTASAIRVTPTITAPEGESPGGGFVIWLTNDARRLPVRMEAQLPVGKFALALSRTSGV